MLILDKRENHSVGYKGIKYKTLREKVLGQLKDVNGQDYDRVFELLYQKGYVTPYDQRKKQNNRHYHINSSM